MAEDERVRAPAAEPATTRARLAVHGLHVALGGAAVLHDVNVDVPPGETVAVLGPSGCGKTTLLRAVAGLVDPRAGRILLDGDDVTGRPAHTRGVGLMFQDHALFPHRDVGANVGFGLRMHGASRGEQRRRVGQVLELVGLPGWERRRVGSLSGGEAQRVALARALAPAPRLLCLDEPLGSLDRVLHDRLVDDLRRLFTGLELSVIYVTHDQREALAMADRLVVLGDGRVLQRGRPAEVWRNPVSEEVARFLGQDVVVDVEVHDREVRAGASVVLSSLDVPDGAHRLVVRPDAVELLDADARGPALGATVTDVGFEGDRTTVQVRPDEPALPLLRAHAGGTPSAPGERVQVRIAAAGTSVLPRA